MAFPGINIIFRTPPDFFGAAAPPVMYIYTDGGAAARALAKRL